MKKLLLGLMLVVMSLGFVGCGKDLSIPKNFEGKYQRIEKGAYESKHIVEITKIGKNQYKVEAKRYYAGKLRSKLEQTFEIIGVKKDREKDPTDISYEIKELGKGKYLEKEWKYVGEKYIDYTDPTWKNSSINVGISYNYGANITKIYINYNNYDVNGDGYIATKKGIEL